MNTVIITGVGGFIGSHLCRRLLNYGVKVIGVDITETVHRQFVSPLYQPITASFEDYTHLHEIVKEPVSVKA